MTASPARFTFDLDLGRQKERNAVVTETAMSEMLKEARNEGFAAGLAEGERSTASRTAKQLAAAAEALANRAAAMTASLDDARKLAISDAVTLAVSVARKLAGGLVAREPAAELAVLLADSLASLNGVPHLVIRCEPSLADAVRDLATARIHTSGFTGRLVVLGDPEIALGDVRIEWADGGVVRDVAKISAEIDARITEYFAARGIPTPAVAPATEEIEP